MFSDNGAKNLMTTLRQVNHVVRSSNLSLRTDIKTHQEQLNIQVKDSLNIKQNNKSLLEFVVMTMIDKKTSQRVCCFKWKNRDWVSSFSLFSNLISMTILCPLIDIDARIKIIYMDSSHIKLLRCFLNIDSSHIYKNNLSLRLRLDVDNN